MAQKRTIVLLESEWSDGFRVARNLSNDIPVGASVKPFLEGYCALWGGELVYRQFTDTKSLTHWIHAIGASRTYTNGSVILYIAGHGMTESCIYGKTNGYITAAQIGEAVAGIRAIDGILVDSCHFGRKGIHTVFDYSEARWAAGYTISVDWLASMMLNLLLFRWIYSAEGKRTYRLTPVGDRICYGIQGLSPKGRKYRKETVVDYRKVGKALGFNVLYREGDEVGTVRDLYEDV